MITSPPQVGQYGVILADPPWHTITWGPGGRDRCPDGPRLLASGDGYPTMTLAELQALPVASWGARDCRLFMWTTDAHLPQALELGVAWGFIYSTVAFVWVKRTCTGREWQFAGGHATRKGVELCLLFLRGKLHRRSASVRQLVIAPVVRGKHGKYKHSGKPAEVRNRIMELVDGPYLELFARERCFGWDSWGLEVELLDQSDSSLDEPAPKSLVIT